MSDELEEDQVYVYAKAFFKTSGWILLGGQPPRGCDHLPVIEIKAIVRPALGSKGAYKPDLVSYKDGIFLLVECKPTHHEGDAAKLREVLGDAKRIAVLYAEMQQRGLFSRHRIRISPTEFVRSVRGALAHGGVPHEQSDLYVLKVSRDPKQSQLLTPVTGTKI